MSAIDDGGAGQGWFVRLSRFLRARAEERAEAPADLPSSRTVPTPPEIVLLDAVVSGMPDPVTVLDQDGRVIAFNAQASVLAPALRRGEPASIALRMPELVEAIRAANLTGKAQRIEFSARLPSPDRHARRSCPTCRSCRGSRSRHGAAGSSLRRKP